MNPLSLPWLEISITLPLLGALIVVTLRDPARAARWCLVFTGATFLSSFLTWLASYLGIAPLPGLLSLAPASPSGRPWLDVDELSAPLLPLVALLHLLATLTTARTKMVRMSFAGLLATESVRLATFGCREPWTLIVLLALGTLPMLPELERRRRPTRVYVIHMGLFLALLLLGWVSVDPQAPTQTTGATLLLLAAVLLRSGTFPVHCWVTDLFEHASFGAALLMVAPITGAYAAVRLVLPTAPDWALQGIGLVSLGTAVYAAGMAVVQREARRFFAMLFVSHSALVLVGLELVTPISLTGSLALWFSVALSLSGLGMTLRALEARFGRLTLTDYHGLYEHSPTLAVFFLITGLASVGFPGTLSFVASEVLVDGAVEANLYVGLGVVVAGALNGIAVMRAYFLLFTGSRHQTSVSLRVTPREWIAILTLTILILGGGLFPQPGLRSRYRAAEELLAERRNRLGVPPEDSRGHAHAGPHGLLEGPPAAP